MFVLTMLLLKEKQRTAELLQQQAEMSNAAQLRLSSIIEQNFAQLRAADPWQYQTIMATGMSTQYTGDYDPSPEAEAKRIAARDNSQEELEETLSAEEAAVLNSIFPGYTAAGS